MPTREDREVERWGADTLIYMRVRVALLVAVAFLVAACSPDEAGDTSTSTAETSTTSTHATTTTSTTLAPTTTTSTAATTTTTLAATTTIVASTTTTAADLEVELSDEGIQAGPDWLPFGHDDDDLVAKLSAILGPPAFDSGWLDSQTDGWQQFGVCPDPNVRGVSWDVGGADGSLLTLFTDADSDFWTGGVQHFFAFSHGGSSDPGNPTTTEGIGIGSSLGDLKAAYDPAKLVIEEAWFDPAQGAWSYDAQDWTGLWGFATGQTDAHAVTSINGGRGCGE